MNVIKNIFFLLNITNTRLGTVCLGEMIHGMFLAAPTGILLFIVWELFEKQPDRKSIWATVIIMTVMFVVQLWVARKVMIRTNDVIYTMTSRLRILLGNHLQKLSLGFYKKRDPGDLASVVLQDVSNFEAIFSHQFQTIMASVFGTLFLSIFLFILDWRLALLMIAAIPCACLLVVISTIAARKYSYRHIASRNETGSRFIEYVQGVQYLKAFNLTGERFSKLKRAFETLRVDSIKLEAVFGPLVITSITVFELFFLLMIYVSLNGLNAAEGWSVTVPVFVAFLILGYRLYTPLQVLMASYAELNYMNVSVERIRQLLESPLQPSGRNTSPERFDIVFENVSFSYVDKNVLQNISLTFPEKGLTALVGASGSGKTTITNLVARFWDVQKGTIRIGGIDVRDMSPQTVCGLISQVFQDVYLFDDSIYNNIKVGNPLASEEEILDAAKKAQVFEFINDLENGLHTRVGEGGAKLSGGQKQRISIARAMLKNAPIILLDEATAALDPENEIYIQLAIQELVKEKTVVVIAHKLQTIRNADKIIVIQDGQILETGNHVELMEMQGLYSRYWKTQQEAGGWKISNDYKAA